MRTAVAHGLAILAMLPVLFVAFVLILNGGQLDGATGLAATIYMTFFGPVVLIATLIYYAVFRARNAAIGALVLASVAVLLGTQVPFVVDIFGRWLLIFLAGFVAAITHHVIVRLVRGRTAVAPPAA
jgi:hypothetical protein